MNRWQSCYIGYLVVLIVLFTACAPVEPAKVERVEITSKRSYQIKDDSKNTAKLKKKGVVGQKNYHIITRGDTLYSIAFRHKLDYRQLAEWNQLSAPYVIYEDDILRLIPPKTPAVPGDPIQSAPDNKTKTPAANIVTKKKTRATTLNASESAIKTKKGNKKTGVEWRWPTTTRKVVDLKTRTGEKGINLAGKIGQEVMAAAAGEVVYSGDKLELYGNLVIIKHDEIYLSAYAYNAELLVTEGDRVVAGQRISIMGDAPLGGGPVLHFEIRKKGKPVDPLTLLPKG